MRGSLVCAAGNNIFFANADAQGWLRLGVCTLPFTNHDYMVMLLQLLQMYWWGHEIR